MQEWTDLQDFQTTKALCHYVKKWRKCFRLFPPNNRKDQIWYQLETETVSHPALFQEILFSKWNFSGGNSPLAESFTCYKIIIIIYFDTEHRSKVLAQLDSFAMMHHEMPTSHLPACCLISLYFFWWIWLDCFCGKSAIKPIFSWCYENTGFEELVECYHQMSRMFILGDVAHKKSEINERLDRETLCLVKTPHFCHW